VSQVDLVPTISLMLGIPVPFSNLGTVIVDLFDYDPLRTNNTRTRVLQKLTALQQNAEQVQCFLHKYNEQSNDLPQLQLTMLEEEYRSAKSQLKELFSHVSSNENISDEALSALANRYIDYLGRVRDLCRSVWSKFDLVTMTVGGFVIICAFLFNVVLALCEPKSTQLSAVVFVAVSTVGLSGVAGLLQLQSPGLFLLLTSFAIAFFLIVIFLFVGKHIVAWILSCSGCFQLLEVFSAALCSVHSVSLLSNSFVVYEDRSTLFLVQSLLIVQTFVVLCRRLSTVDQGAKRRTPKEFSWPSFYYIALLIVIFAVCVRTSALFRLCREEQTDCEVSWFSQPLSAVLMKFEQFRLARMSVSVAAVVFIVVVVTAWMRHCGNLNGLEPTVVAVRYIVPLLGICLIVYWIVDGFVLPAGTSRLTVASITVLPQLIYWLSLAVVIVIVINPLCVFVLRPQQDTVVDEQCIERLRNASHEERITQIYGHVRKNWRSVLKTTDARDQSDDTPIVYGLATVYSSGHIALLTAVAMVMMLVLGDNMAPSIALWVVCEICLLELHAAYVHCWSVEGKLINVTSFSHSITGVILCLSTVFTIDRCLSVQKRGTGVLSLF